MKKFSSLLTSLAMAVSPIVQRAAFARGDAYGWVCRGEGIVYVNGNSWSYMEFEGRGLTELPKILRGSGTRINDDQIIINGTVVTRLGSTAWLEKCGPDPR